MLSPKKRSIFEELNSSFVVTAMESRGEDAWGAAVRFLTMLDTNVDDTDKRRKLMNAWIRSIKDQDYSKFRRALRRYLRDTDGSGEN